MTALTRRACLLGAALLLPLLASADPLDALGYVVIAAVIMLGISATSVALTVAAYWWPASRALFWAQFLVLLPSLALGLLLTRLPYHSGNWPFIGHFNPLLQVVVPVGAWLNGVLLARQTPRDSARYWWLAMAILGLNGLLFVVPALLLNSYLSSPHAYSPGLQAAYMLLGILLGVMSYWLVIKQLEATLTPRFWQPWWRVPTVVAAAGAAYFSLSLYVQLGSNASLPWYTVASLLGRTAALTWVAGVAALLVLKPGQRVS